jgi:hypothetical protein
MALPALAGSQLHNRFQQWDFERLERSAVKVARSVLRGRRRSNASLLPDVRREVALFVVLPPTSGGRKPGVPSPVVYRCMRGW